MRKLISLLFFISVSVQAQQPTVRSIVTYSNFSYIRSVTASIDHVYFASTEGITRYDKNLQVWVDPLTGIVGIDDQDIKSISVDHFDEKLYAATTFNLLEYDIRFENWFPVSEIPPIDPAPIHIKAPQVMYPPFGYNYSGGEQLLIDRFGRNYRFADAIDDGAGTYWLGTWGDGAATAETASNVITMLPFGLIQNRVNAIYNDNGRFFVSGAVFDNLRTGITYFDPALNEFAYIESGLSPQFPSVDVNCLDGDENNLYIGTEAGLVTFDKNSENIGRRITARHGLISENILCVKPLDSVIFIGTDNGFQILPLNNDSTLFFIPEVLAGRAVYDLEFADNALWIATEDGLFKFNPQTKKLQRFQDPTMILFGSVYDIYNHNQQLWFAADDGLLRLDLKSGETEAFNDLAANKSFRSVIANDRIVAYGSDDGLKIIKLNEKRNRLIELTKRDGLASDIVYDLVLDGEFLWIGSDRGLTRLWWEDPDLLN